MNIKSLLWRVVYAVILVVILVFIVPLIFELVGIGIPAGPGDRAAAILLRVPDLALCLFRTRTTRTVLKRMSESDY